MKKSLVALAALTAVSAFAQSSVTLSGGVSMGYTKATTARTASSATQSIGVGGVDAVNSNSFIFTATEDLGGGLKATGLIQQRLNGAVGANQNVDGQAGDLSLEVAGGFGSVRVGKYTFLSHSGYNPFASRLVTANGTTASVGINGNNTLSYVTPTMSGFTAAIAATLATSSAGSDAAALRVGYVAGPLNVQAGVSRGGLTTGTGGQATTNSLAGTYDLGTAKMFGSMYTTKAGAGGTVTSATGVPAASGTQIGLSVPMGALTAKLSIRNNKKGDPASAIDRTAAGIDYALSKRTTFVAEFASDKQADTGLYKTNNYFVGLAHTF
jgi:hypothetical protein